jgi:alpha-ribazole phosphatase
VRLLMVRHGATANNVEARYTGQSDVPMSALGERQAEALAARLASQTFDTIVTSDLRRARAVAELVARSRDCPLIEERDLREISLGEWEGSTFAEIATRDPELFAAWQRDPTQNVPPGGESLTAFAARVARALERWRQGDEARAVLWVTHGGVIGVALCLLLGLPLERRWQFRRDNASICEVEIGLDERREDAVPRGTYAILMRANDTAHLDGLALEGPGEKSQIL